MLGRSYLPVQFCMTDPLSLLDYFYNFYPSLQVFSRRV